jgi:hypothetical protein
MFAADAGINVRGGVSKAKGSSGLPRQPAKRRQQHDRAMYRVFLIVYLWSGWYLLCPAHVESKYDIIKFRFIIESMQLLLN